MRARDSLLMFNLGDEEISYHVCGSVGGVVGPRWGERKYQFFCDDE
jgi:hypothetical protein